MDKFVNTIITGDALAVLRTLPDNLVQTCITSPPYFGLRDYQTETILQLEGDPQDCQHVWIHEGRNEDGAKVAQCQHCFAVKVDRQIGLEETPEAYIARLVAVFHEVRRVLKPSGTLWVNIGDSYCGYKGDHYNENQRRGTGEYSPVPASHNRGTPHTMHGIKNKDLIGIPWMLAFALRADGWYLRSDIIWSKSNCMPESVQDRPTKSHEYLFLLAKSERYYYDADAIREEHQTGIKKFGSTWEERKANGTPSRYGFNSAIQSLDWMGKHPLGRNKRSVWSVSTIAYSEAHFAVFPPKLIEPCILAGSQPGDIVLDCFMGAGTTALVAIQHSRNYLGIELNKAYVTLAEKRIQHVQQHLWTGEGIA